MSAHAEQLLTPCDDATGALAPSVAERAAGNLDESSEAVRTSCRWHGQRHVERARALLATVTLPSSR